MHDSQLCDACLPHTQPGLVYALVKRHGIEFGQRTKMVSPGQAFDTAVRMPLKMPISSMEVPGLNLLLIEPPARVHPRLQQVEMAPVTGALLSTQEARMTPGFCLVLPWLLPASGKRRITLPFINEAKIRMKGKSVVP